MHKLGSPTCSLACLITPPNASTSYCPGIGSGRTSLLKPPERKAQPILKNRPIPWSSPDAYAAVEPKHTATALEDHGIPLDWLEGVARLDCQRSPSDVPQHRWRQFVGDCQNFLTTGCRRSAARSRCSRTGRCRPPSSCCAAASTTPTQSCMETQP